MSRFDKDGWIDDEFVILIKVYLRDGSAEKSLRNASSASSRMAFGVLCWDMTEEAKVRVASMWAALGPE